MVDAGMAADGGSWPLRVGTRSVDEFELWVSPYVTAMAFLAGRLVGLRDRDDVVQESLVRAWRRWETYRPECGTPEVWLLAIVADRSKRRWRRKLGTSPLADIGIEEVLPDVDLERAVRLLPPRQRLAVELHYFVGLTTAQAAAVMGRSEGTVKSALHDARASLREALEEHD